MSLYLNYLDDQSRSSSSCSLKTNFRRSAFEKAQSFYFSDLKAHFGCVNAIEFSNNQLLLASGGDDKRVLVWSVSKALTTAVTHKVPHKMASEHNSNIFCLTFNITDSCVISAGNDGCIILHDLASGRPRNTYLCTEAIHCLSSDPLNDFVFAATSHEGNVLVYDSRCHSGYFYLESLTFGDTEEPMYSVQYNPSAPRYLATVSSRHTPRLWDIRNTSRPVLEYKYSSGKYNGMSLSFNDRGDRLLLIGRWNPPLVYDVTRTTPIHEFHASGYYSACTIKSCCWVGPGNEYIATGSDDFNVYMWKVPDESSFQNYQVKVASKVLKGHRSVVNQVRYNDEYNLLVSSGVEKIVKAWSPFSIAHVDDQKLSERFVYSHEEYLRFTRAAGGLMSHNYAMECMEEDSRMIAFFDSLVQRQLEANLSESESEESTQRLYDYEISSSADSSTNSSARQSANENAVLSSDSEEVAEMSPFTSAFAASVLQDGEVTPEVVSSQTPSAQPKTQVTMSELIRKKKEQDLANSLALAKRKLKRQKRKADLRESRTEDTDSDSDVNLTASQRKAQRRRREKMKRILTRIGVRELRSQSRENEAVTMTSIPDTAPVDVNERLSELRGSWSSRSTTPALNVLKQLRQSGDWESREFGEKHNTGSRQQSGGSSSHSSSMTSRNDVNVGASTSEHTSNTSLFKSRSKKRNSNMKIKSYASSDTEG